MEMGLPQGFALLQQVVKDSQRVSVLSTPQNQKNKMNVPVECRET